ncbi:DNA/RNA nuclease SfsA [Saccharophagus sp. K07]|uniref:DNA/RNA nuclease SfsA n=1 Tax=Saccharophagus sp. K07 TaxID=2283636 RepID=UPI0016522FD5|nr:DNA/RNA nuclease SfsA [Saccharophagus sp. K07]
MLFPSPLEQGLLIRRYKRFFADIQLANGEILTAHCPNTGSMKNCIVEGAPAWFSRSVDPKRKLSATWEIATTPTGHLAGINTGRANKLVHEALLNGLIAELVDYDSLRAEVIYGEERSRIDFLLHKNGQPIYLEVKSVTLAENDGMGYFPDAVSQRGARHLRELVQMVKNGHRAVLLYCVQHTGIEVVAPAAHIDAVYAEAFRTAVAAGVEVYALGADISPQAITLSRRLPVKLDG